MLLSIWYNSSKNSFYIKIYKSAIFDKKVGYVNQFNHVLTQALFIQKNGLINADDFWDYHRKTKIEKKNKKKLIDVLKEHLLYRK